MDIKGIKDIVNSDSLSNEAKESKIIDCLAQDENVIPLVMTILRREREMKSEVLVEMNLLLSKAESGLESPKLNRGGFIQKEIMEFYEKYKNVVNHCFKDILQ
jgi:hypothetical protein